MKNNAAEWLKDSLLNIGIDEGTADLMGQFITVISIIIIATTVNFILKYILIKLINRAITRITSNFEIRLYITKILNRIVNLILIILITSFLPAAFSPNSKLLTILMRICAIIIICLIVIVINSFLKIGYEIISKKKKYKQKPIKGFFQIIQIIIFFIGGVIIIAIVIDKSPAGLLTGLGAFAAVLSLIFKDTILGFISGIQLSSNDMIKPGDWITVENSIANGVVMDITLITVKVQNFDNTIVTVPTYSLITSSFQNWRGMQDSGGRRIMVAINIDISTIKFCTEQQADELSKLVQVPTLPNNKLTNLEMYRIYLTTYLHNNPHVNNNILTMVRYLAPTPQGIPVQIYCFSGNKDWVIYEGIQSEILEHAIAICPRFELKIFQTLSTLST
ncbi:MAG: mechanosensitive ion channel [Bacteroidales bacterium]